MLEISSLEEFTLRYWMNEFLDGHEEACDECFRLPPAIFFWTLPPTLFLLASFLRLVMSLFFASCLLTHAHKQTYIKIHLFINFAAGCLRLSFQIFFSLNLYCFLRLLHCNVHLFCNERQFCTRQLQAPEQTNAFNSCLVSLYVERTQYAGFRKKS